MRRLELLPIDKPTDTRVRWYIEGSKWVVLPILVFAAFGLGNWIGMILLALGL